MKQKIKKLVKEYVEAERKLVDELDKLKNGGDECNCDKTEDIIRVIHEGEWPEIITLCLKCGGYLVI